MRVVLSTVTNQYGEKIADEILYILPEKGRVELETLNCYSSISLGLGTCRCVSHNTWNEPVEVSPQEARELVKEAYKKGEIDEQELQKALGEIDKTEVIAKELQRQKEYYKKNPIQLLLDHFGVKSQEELEDHILSCYILNINPLPQLRKVLKPYGWDVRYVAITRDLNGSYNTPCGMCEGIIGCWVWWDENQPIDVELVVGDFPCDERREEITEEELVDFIPEE